MRSVPTQSSVFRARERDPTRYLLALWEAHEPFSGDDAVAFTTLRKRVGMRDSGQFHYHLDKLDGDFVEATDDGYALSNAGYTLVGAVIAGVGIEDPSFEGTEAAVRCPFCDARLSIEYGNRRLTASCRECGAGMETDDEDSDAILMNTPFDPAGVVNRTPEELVAANGVRTLGNEIVRLGDVCPECTGTVDFSYDICDDHDSVDGGPCPRCGRHEAIMVRHVCTVCKSVMQTSPEFVALLHPRVSVLLADWGVTFGLEADEGNDYEKTLELYRTLEWEYGVVSDDPLRVQVRIGDDGRRFRVTSNEDVKTIEVEELDADAE